MPKPQLRAVDNDKPHARDIARQRVAEWRSNAETQGLPRVNIIDTGAPLLDRDKVLSHDHHQRRLGRKV